MTKKITLTKYKIRKFKNSDFREVFKLFVDFQDLTKIGTFYNLGKGQNDMFYKIYLLDEFKKLLKKCEKSYVAIDEKRNKIFGFACFSRNIVGPNSYELQLVFKSIEYKFNLKIKKCLEDVFKKLDSKDVYTILGQREDFERYKKFVHYVFGIKFSKKLDLDKTLIKFNEVSN
tara:strand:- start:54 stop:572 length:519 start_codon:yes stop_codon:yes gene_type:complete